MKKLNGKYIILELIPTHSKSEYGFIAQLQALKLDGLKLIERFDERVVKELISNKDLLQMISYNQSSFNYTENEHGILKDFLKWSENLPLLIIDNEYTIGYLKDLPNKKESIFKYLNFQYSDDVIDKIMEKYNLEPSDNIVDLLYEALIYECNNN